MSYFAMRGLRRYIPVAARVKRAARGLEAAARQKKIFHLWFHPTDMAVHTDAMFAGLRAILEHARTLRARQELTVLPMGNLVPAADWSLHGEAV
jgi:hypothetical protein